jgi:hypothetical protein
LAAVAYAVIVHVTPHRMRIKIPGWERCDADFAGLQWRLERCPGVITVRANPLVASITIHCGADFELASLRPCFGSLEGTVQASDAATSAEGEVRQIAWSSYSGGRPAIAISLAPLLVRLAIAAATRRFAAVISELVLQAAVWALLRHRDQGPPPGSLQAPRPLPAAAAG